MTETFRFFSQTIDGKASLYLESKYNQYITEILKYSFQILILSASFPSERTTDRYILIKRLKNTVSKNVTKTRMNVRAKRQN